MQKQVADMTRKCLYLHTCDYMLTRESYVLFMPQLCVYVMVCVCVCVCVGVDKDLFFPHID